MAHEIETSAFDYAVGAPWHGLGNKIPGNASLEDVIDLAGLNWRVELEPMYRKINDTYIQHESASFIKRNDTNGVLDIVGPDYRPIQNRDALEFFREFLNAGHMQMDAAGSLRGGKFVWGLARMRDGYEVSRGDRSEGYLLMLKPHQQGEAMHITTTSVRVVCMNTTKLALGWSGHGPIPAKVDAYRVAHNSVWNEVRMAEAREFLGLARDGVSKLADVQRKLAETPITRDKMIELLAPIYAPNFEMQELLTKLEDSGARTLKRVLNCVYTGPGATPENAWGTYNGVTYFQDHVVGRSADVRLTSTWTGAGAKNKSQILRDLHRYALEV